MGIAGLTSLIQNEPTVFFKSIKVHDTFLVIDGNCISCWLYRRFCHKSALNGDYNEYERCVRNFFSLLKRCNIFPVVILDGATEDRKLKTVKERMAKTISDHQRINTIHLKGDHCIPALLTDVFKDIMTDMEILFCQSFLEADLDTTKIAQFLNCPVLSFDSDFYLDDVDYIPFSTLNLQPVELKKSEEASSSKHFIFGKLFQRKSFLECFGNLPNLSFLPLLSFLLGNDYSGKETYKLFFSHLSGSMKVQNLKQKISLLCRWLQNFNSPETALEKLLEYIPAKSRQRTKRELTRCLIEKNSNEQSYLVLYLQHSLPLMAATAGFPAVLRKKIKVTKESSGWLEKAAACILPIGMAITLHAKAMLPIPDYILAQFIEGELSRNLFQLFYSQSVFFAVQMEEHSLPSVSAGTYEILQNVFAIICHDHSKKNTLRFVAYCRKGNDLGKQSLTPVFSNPPLSLAQMSELSLQGRTKIAFDLLQIEQMHETVVPDNWKLFFLTVAHWYREDSSRIMTLALGCIIFSSIFIGVIDKKIGCYEEENSFLEKFSEDWNKIINERQAQKENSITSFPTEDFLSAVNNIDKDDCILALKHFISLRDRSISKVRFPTKLFKPILHTFAQLQNDIMVIGILNAILSFPFQSLKIADFYCGTLAYNVYFKIKNHKNLEGFVRVEFKQMPTLQTLFLSAFKVINKLSKCELPIKQPQTKKKSRNQQKKHFNTK